MLNNNDSQLREMAAFRAWPSCAEPGQSGWHLPRIWPATAVGPAGLERRGNLQHNAAFALYGLADHEDNVPDIVREGTVQRLKDRELIVQASKDCVQKTLKRLEDKMTGRVLRYLIYLMTTSNKVITHRIAVALAYLCRDEDMRLIFMEKGGMDILLNMLVPKFGHHESMKPNDAQHLSNQKMPLPRCTSSRRRLGGSVRKRMRRCLPPPRRIWRSTSTTPSSAIFDS